MMGRKSWSAAILVTMCTLAPWARAQMSACHDMGSMQPVPPPEQLPAASKMTGIGNGHLKITATVEAQAWFDQGLNLLHDFWDYESAKAFEQAIRVDPSCAMCQWGLAEALANAHNQGGSYSEMAIARAQALKSRATPKEQRMIEATALQLTEHHTAGRSDAQDTKESEATTKWREAVKLDPTDPQARIFLAESLLDGYDDAGEPREGTRKAVAELEEVLKTAPGDSAANHYWIHAMEPSSHPERALESAKKLAGLAPASGHMVHMPGHIFYRVGDYAQAEHWFTASTEVDEAYLRTSHVSIDDDWNYVHNLMYAIDNLMEEGKLEQATALSAKLAGARGQRSDTLYISTPRDGMTRINTLLPIALRKGDWRDVETLLAQSQPDAKLENLLFLSGELKTFAHGMIAVESGNVAAAQLDSNALDAALWRKSQSLKDAAMEHHDGAKKDEPKQDSAVMTALMPDALAEPLVSVLGIMSLELRASILADQKNLPEAKRLFVQAAHEEKQLGYREPPTYIRPVGETEGFALLHAGDPEGAHTAFAAALVERPNAGFPLYGMALSSEAAKKPTQAREEYGRFLDAWRNADPSAEMERARAYVKGTPVMAEVR
jgi:tetratricopeptide (TPR) repeat protein